MNKHTLLFVRYRIVLACSKMLSWQLNKLEGVLIKIEMKLPPME